MKTKSILISILLLFVSCSVTRAQFNTIGQVQSKRIHKKKDPQEARQLAPVDSIASLDSVTNISDMEGMIGGVTCISNASDFILPLLHVSLPLKRAPCMSASGEIVRNPACAKA